MTRRLSLGMVAVMALSLLWIALPSAADTTRIRAVRTDSGWEWQPRTRYISKGDRVIWKNPTSATHTVTAYSPNWSKNTVIEPGERTSKIFRRTGRYKFRCVIRGHSVISDGRCYGMCGKVVVR